MNPNAAFIKLQIAVRDGHATLSDGLPLPTLGTSVEGQLKVPAGAFDDPALFRLMSEKHDVELLSKGMEVLIGISAKAIPSHLPLTSPIRTLPPLLMNIIFYLIQKRITWYTDPAWITAQTMFLRMPNEKRI